MPAGAAGRGDAGDPRVARAGRAAAAPGAGGDGQGAAAGEDEADAAARARARPTTVHIGRRPVGTLRPADAARFDATFTAAALLDEDPVVQARLTRTTLELPVPRR